MLERMKRIARQDYRRVTNFGVTRKSSIIGFCCTIWIVWLPMTSFTGLSIEIGSSLCAKFQQIVKERIITHCITCPWLVFLYQFNIYWTKGSTSTFEAEGMRQRCRQHVTMTTRQYCDYWLRKRPATTLKTNDMRLRCMQHVCETMRQ